MLIELVVGDAEPEGWALVDAADDALGDELVTAMPPLALAELVGSGLAPGLIKPPAASAPRATPRMSPPARSGATTFGKRVPGDSFPVEMSPSRAWAMAR